MGFSSSLQGRSSHEALLARQDAELRLLESIKRWLTLRIKCDRDYATALVSVNVKIENPDELLGSPLAQAVQSAVEDSEALSQLFKQNADYLANVTIEKLNALLQDKRSSRKFYHDEYQRLTSELSSVQESVGRSRLEYEKSLEVFKSLKSKYEECLSNTSKGKGTSKKNEEALREKFQRAVKRLHVAHNDYVLLLLEAADFERDFRTILLPGLLEFQQAVQEDLVTQCRSVLDEIARHTDFGSEAFTQLFAKLRNRVEQVTPENEFREFIEKHKSTPPAAQPPIFDSKLSLVHENSHFLINPLRPDKITVDDLTLEALKQKLRMLEQRLSAVQNEATSKQTLLSQREMELAASMKNGASSTELSVARRQVEGIRRQVSELRCLEQKWQRQIDAIAEAVSKLGGQVPSACELHICDANNGSTLPIDDEPTSQSASSSSSSNGNSVSQNSLGKRRGQSLVDMIRRPFSRKSMTPPASPSSQSKQAREDQQQQQELGKSEESLGSITPVAEVSDEPFIQMEENVVPALSQDFSAVPLPLPPTPNNDSIPAVAAGLAEQEWFHGVLPREEVVRLLVNDGDFLVRETTRHEERQVVLSCSWGGHKHFIVQTTPEGLYRFEGPAFPTVQELIMYQLNSELPVTTKSGAILKHPVPRERWELNNDDLELVEKIGRGNFGDVYKALLRPSGISVAVKTCRHTLPEEQKKKFLQEGRILKQYEHRNIVQLIGICVQKQPIMIVMELVSGGSLLNFLRQKSTNLSCKQLLLMCLDVAAGMSYLESRNCIHRDLAARNCLVGENNIVKISDFGMSREEQEYIVSDGMKQIPIKWTAPEALNYGKYTSLCDVWSFGVLCWEVFSRGGVPYSGLSNTRARQMIDAGYRMPAPDGTPEEVYRLMRRCWEYEPERRPHFDEVSQVLDLLIKASS